MHISVGLHKCVTSQGKKSNWKHL